MHKNTKSPFQLSIERLDCTLGYTKDNSVLVCLSLNYGRNNCDITDFKKHLEKIQLKKQIAII